MSPKTRKNLSVHAPSGTDGSMRRFDLPSRAHTSGMQERDRRDAPDASAGTQKSVTKYSSLQQPARGKRQRLIEAMARARLLPLLQPLHDRGRRSFTVLAYHRVVRLHEPGGAPYDLDLVSATPESFEWQMRFLREHMNPVSLAEVIACAEGTGALPERAVAVTFDDGFSDTYEHAFPILRRHSIPATVFVTTGYVDSGEPFWFEIAAVLMMRAAPRTIHLPDHSGALPTGDSESERRASLRALQQSLKDLPDSRRRELISDWLISHAALIDSAPAAIARPMSWGQVKEMSAAGIEFGAHSVTHPNLAKLGDEELDWELRHSRRTLQEQLDTDIVTLAYPIGTRSAYDDRVIARAGAAGYRLGVSYLFGANWQRALKPFELRRQSVGLETSQLYFQALVRLPEWVR
jgi:peptidoglycan/xylan/chitin deacetylase (PgdA/CDA1 family)